MGKCGRGRSGRGIGRRTFLQGAASGLALSSLSSKVSLGATSSTRTPKNLIFIVADTFRADHLGCYGSTRVSTPNLDRLSEESTTFTNAYADGLPTIPCRRVYQTGKTIVPMRKHGGWIPLQKGRTTLPQILSRNGFTCGFIADTYHYFKPDMNFHRGFHSWQWVRGQESDRYRSGPAVKLDPKRHMPKHLWNSNYDRNMRQYLMNTQDVKSEEDYFCARTLQAGVEWLKRNASSNRFMLWLDTFDPHEPWDAPKRFQRMYRKDYPADRTLFGYGVQHKDVRSSDYPWIKDLYAAECTFVDHWMGWFMERVAELGLLDDTIVVFSTDHGTHLGEEGCVQKTPALLNRCVSQLPLIIRHPSRGLAGTRVDALVGGADYMPSFLDMLGVKHDEQLDGESFWPLMTGQKRTIHDYVVTEFRNFAAVRNHEWCYFQNTGSKECFQPSFVKQQSEEIANKKVGSPHLYNLETDPRETDNVVLEHMNLAAKMQDLLEKPYFG